MTYLTPEQKTEVISRLHQQTDYQIAIALEIPLGTVWQVRRKETPKTLPFILDRFLSDSPAFVKDAGQIPDTDLALRYKIPIHKARYYRETLNIPSYKESNKHQSTNKIQTHADLRSLVGKLPDKALAKAYDTPLLEIQQQRRALDREPLKIPQVPKHYHIALSTLTREQRSALHTARQHFGQYFRAALFYLWNPVNPLNPPGYPCFMQKEMVIFEQLNQRTQGNPYKIGY